jgi:aminoglycoside phosphotransferase (APT) family kinase protein
MGQHVVPRLGEEFIVRLPRADGYIPQVAKEQEWLPVLASELPLPIPVPVALGVPSALFPRPRSVYRWFPGQTAATGGIDDLQRFAADLGAFLHALQSIDTVGGPAAGPESHWRGGDLCVYDDNTREAVADLTGWVDRDVVLAAWERATATVWERAPVWVHGDVAASNGRLTSVIDFGCSAIGDPACDLVIAWTLFADESRREFRARMVLDDDTWERASPSSP